jgi:hypothetical protein
MPERVLLDNDVVFKAVSYRLGKALVDATTYEGVPPSIVKVAEYTLRDIARRSKQIENKQGVQAELESTLEDIQRLEPTEEEVLLAADFEQKARDLALELDGGESQLFAILLSRNARLMVTGDKRAVRALELISPLEGYRRVACFEQLIAAIIKVLGHSKVRTKICGEPRTDKAMTMCFSCGLSTAAPENIDEGLKSYINSIRQTAPNVLASGVTLFAELS